LKRMMRVQVYMAVPFGWVGWALETSYRGRAATGAKP
jgi:hypothetical protein